MHKNLSAMHIVTQLPAHKHLHEESNARCCGTVSPSWESSSLRMLGVFGVLNSCQMVSAA